MKRSRAVNSLLFEAYRRNDMADSLEKQKPLKERWLGLGTASAYRPVLEAGLMTWHDGRTPPKRCVGWLVLTDEGVKAYHEMESEFSKVLTAIKADVRYRHSYTAHYMLAGGLVTR